MTLYRYQVSTPDEKIVRRYGQASSLTEIHRQCHERGEVFLWGIPILFWKQRYLLTSSDYYRLTRRMASLLKAHLSFQEALDLTVSHLKSSLPIYILGSHLRLYLSEGLSLEESFLNCPIPVHPVFSQRLIVAEKAGTVPETCEALGAYYHTLRHQESAWRKTLTYPALMILAVFGVLGFFLYEVIPELAKAFDHPSPSLAYRSLISLSKGCQDWGFWILILIAGLCLGFSVAAKVFSRHGLTYKVPWIGPLLLRIHRVKFLLMIQELLKARFSIGESLSLSRSFYPYFANPLLSSLENGKTFSEALTTHPEIFPYFLTSLSKMGEHTGNLDEVVSLGYTMDYEILEDFYDTALRWVKPAITCIIGCVLLWIVCGIILPIYDQMALLHG